MTAGQSRYSRLRQAGVCVNCGKHPAEGGIYCPGCQKNRDDLRHCRHVPPPPAPPVRIPRERRFVTVVPPFERHPVTFEIVFP